MKQIKRNRLFLTRKTLFVLLAVIVSLIYINLLRHLWNLSELDLYKKEILQLINGSISRSDSDVGCSQAGVSSSPPSEDEIKAVLERNKKQIGIEEPKR